ncbi:MAG: hypothetical protein ACPGZP_01430 [Panacagrimonas sp.]
MRFSKSIGVIATAVACPLAWAHSGPHQASAWADLWHTISSPDHAIPLLMGIAAIIGLFALALRKPRPDRQSRPFVSFRR